MRFSKFIGLSMALVSVWVNAAPDALQDPIPEKIPVGDIVVKATEFLRLPRSSDAHDRPTMLAGIDMPLGSSNAYARAQYMNPVGDGSGRLVISDLRGILYMTDADGENLRPYLDLRRQSPDYAPGVFPNEAGLLGFAFHPDFSLKGRPGHGRFYTAYSATIKSGDAQYHSDPSLSHHSVIREWRTDHPGATVFDGSSREVFRVGQFAQNHNIGTLAFNPAVATGDKDYGMLYVCMGDGGSAYDPYDYGQSLAEPLGAILRIDPLGTKDKAYGIPADNPFAGNDTVAQEIWAYGLRHPQQFSFDDDGTMFINDIGQNHVEEINIGKAGANYGWHLEEGTFSTGFGVGIGISASVFPRGAETAFVDPVAQYDHDEGNAIGSGFVYRGRGIPALQGKYVAADIVKGRLFYFDLADLPDAPVQLKSLRVDINGKVQPLLDAVGYQNTYDPGSKRADLRLGIDEQGELYLLTKGDGWIRKLVAP
jgi:glucose/arabinose dehydrogenase